jgi:hypothetical protein
MTGTPKTRPDPATDPHVRWRVQYALNQVIRAAEDVVTRYSDGKGWYEAPDPVPFGDVGGLITVGNLQVITRLQGQLDEARTVLRAVRAEVDAYQRERFGEVRAEL